MPPNEPTLMFDNFDVDLVLKVLTHTAFSPFFTFWVPILYRAQGVSWSDPMVVYPALYFAAVSLFWLLNWFSTLWRNGGSLLFSPDRYDWGEQIIVVTGGSSGIGALIANTLAVRNVTVAVLDLYPIETENFNINFYKCDVSKWEEVEAVAKKIREELGDPTVIINNAGVVQGKLILDLSEADVRQTIGTNLLSHFWTLKAFLPAMIKEKSGHIVTVGSVLGLAGAAQMSDYCASKAALVNLNQSLRYELDKKYCAPRVRTTLLLPGHVQTRLFAHAKLPQSFLFRFLAPSLPPHAIAKAVIAALDTQESRTVYLPAFTRFVPYSQLLPSWARDFFQWFSGADEAMRDFAKVSGRRSDEDPLPDITGNSDKKD